MGKILHLIPDEKFTENIIENFERVFDDNLFFVLGNNKERKFYKAQNDKVIFHEANSFTVNNVDKEVVAVIVHGLNFTFAKLVVQLDLNIKVAWFVWGYDIYNLPKIIEHLYAPGTFYYLKNRNLSFTLINKIKKNRVLRSFYYKYIKKTYDFYSFYELAHKRIDFFCTYIREDYELFLNFYPNKLKYLEIGYFSIFQYLAGQPDIRIIPTAENILVGNSNSSENNHLDIFQAIKEVDFHGQVFVPLSYGDDQKYKSFVIRKGTEFLKEKFNPLLNFMNRAEYLELLSGCSTAIFYHYRQQAMGNIIALLYMGVRVYLSYNNPVFHYLKRIGIKVFDFDKEFPIFKNSVLEPEFQNNNREILDSRFNDNVLEAQYTSLIDQLTDVDK